MGEIFEKAEPENNTGSFIMYSGITKIYCSRTVGHVFTKPVQIEGTTQKNVSSQEVVFHHSSHFCRQATRVYLVRKWPLQGRSCSVCWNNTQVSPWLLCNVHFVQSICPTIATWPHWPKRTDHCSSEEYRCVCGKNLRIVSVCAMSYAVHTSNISSFQKKNFFSFPVAVNSYIKVGPLVFLL